MGKINKGKLVSLKVEYTEGYQERFTKAILKIYERMINENSIENSKTDKKLEQHVQIL